MKCFGLLAVVLGLLSLALFAPVFAEYMVSHLVPRFPTLIVSGFMALAAIEAIFAALVLDVMVAKDKRDFEYRLNRVCMEKIGKIERRDHMDGLD